MTDRIVSERITARGQPKRGLVAPVNSKMGKRTPSVGLKKGTGAAKGR